jgi:hypothetical protein
MDPATLDPPMVSKCTSCKLSEDFSNYWTASIYFQSPENGTFKRVPQMANGRLNGTLMEQNAGLTVYYMHPFSGTNKNVTVMKPVSLVDELADMHVLTSGRGFECSQGIPHFGIKQAGA